jgi:RNA polymerase sigma factor (sigma-70 family)
MNSFCRTRVTGIDDYLNEIGRYRLLTPDEEITLGKQVQRMRELQKQEGPLTPAEQREVRVGQRAQEKFVRSNLKLVVNVARKYMRSTRSMELMDLVQEGNIGLIKGVEKFDPTRGYKFSTYAYWWIRQAMTRAICTKDRALKLPSKIAEMAMGWSRKVSDLSQQLGRTPTDTELAEHFKCSLEDIALFKERGTLRVLSLDAVCGDDTNMTLSDLLQDPHDPLGEETVDQIFYSGCKKLLPPALTALDQRESDMLIRRWGLKDGVPQTQAEISKDYQLSRERVRQIVGTAERKLKRRLAQMAV